MLLKSRPVTITKAGEEDGLEAGVFEALVSVFGNVDSVRDMVLPDAFDDSLAEWSSKGDPIPIYWSHRMDDPDFNIGHVLDAKAIKTGDKPGLWIKGQLDLDEDAKKARQTYKLLKGRRVTQFSFAYDVIEGAWITKADDDDDESESGYFELRKLKIHEVGPTPVGANQETELLGVKQRRRGTRYKTAIAPHSTSVSEETWDGPAAQANLSNEAGEATYRKAYAWVDPDGDPDAKASYKFIHHEVSDDGAVGSANMTACSSAIAILNGGRGGSSIPDADRQGVYNHLAKHLKDGDREPPELAALDDDGNPIEDDEDDEDDDTKTRRRKAGRVLSAKNETALREVSDQLKVAAKGIDQVLAAVAADEDKSGHVDLKTIADDLAELDLADLELVEVE